MLETDTPSRKRSLLFRRLMAEIQPTLANYPLELGYPPLPVSWKTLHRFWPIVPLYAGKIVTRLRRTLLPSPQSTPGIEDSPRMRLLRDPAMRPVLQFENLFAAELFDKPALRRFLDAAMQPGFAYGDQWAQLLTIEFTLCHLKSAQGPRID